MHALEGVKESFSYKTSQTKLIPIYCNALYTDMIMRKFYSRYFRVPHYSILLLLCLGVLQADSGIIREHNHIFRLYSHECQRVFHDRLVDRTDKKYFNSMLSEMAAKHFSKVKWNCQLSLLANCHIAVLHTLSTHLRLVKMYYFLFRILALNSLKNLL